MLRKLFRIVFSPSLSDAVEALYRPMRYWASVPSNPGAAVSAYVSSGNLDIIKLRLERKIESGDVQNGALLPAATQAVKRRGGKRHTELTISYESAVALHKVLGAALEDVRCRRSLQASMDSLFDYVLVFAEKKSSGTL